MQMYNSEGDLPYPIDAKVLGYVPKYTISASIMLQQKL